MDERQLIEAAQAGDRDAFAALVSRHERFVLALVRWYVGAADAADAAQETWLAMYEKLWQLEDPAKLRAWLRQLVFYQCLNWRKARAVRTRRELYLDSDGWLGLLETVTDDGLPVERIAENRELRHSLSRQLDRLPGDYGPLLRLHYLRGLSYEEIAELTGLPLTTVRWRLHYGRRLLKSRLARNYHAKGVVLDARSDG
ncbi:MAG: RNA polymerase sigma factor [Chloroflexota bacterium]